MGEQSGFPDLMAAMPREFPASRDELRGRSLSPGAAPMPCGRPNPEGAAMLPGWTRLWPGSNGKTKANSIQGKGWIYVPGPKARTC